MEKKHRYKRLIVQYLLKKNAEPWRIVEPRTDKLARPPLSFSTATSAKKKSSASIQALIIYVNFKPIIYDVWHYREDKNTLHDSKRKDHPVTFP
jgi:hypothetical protein